MNTLETVHSSIVGIYSLGKPAKISSSILRMPDGSHRYTTPETLGVACGQLIFSCANIQSYYQTMPAEVDLFAAWFLNEPDIAQGIFCAMYASSLDYLVLAPDSLSVGMSEDGGTETGLQMLFDLEEKLGAGVRPATVEFGPSYDEEKVSGYFFGADGRTTHSARFRLRRGSPFIEFFSNDFNVGCAGSPIFTFDHRLIGFATTASNLPWPNGYCHCYGRRLDLGLPKIISDSIIWDRFIVSPNEVAPLDDDPWLILDQKMDEHLRGSD